VPRGWLCLWHAVAAHRSLSWQAVDCVDFRFGNVSWSKAALSKESPPRCHTRQGDSRICVLPTQDGRKGGCDLGDHLLQPFALRPKRIMGRIRE